MQKLLKVVATASMLGACSPAGKFSVEEEPLPGGARGKAAFRVRSGDVMLLPYEVHGSLALFQDDIILPIEQVPSSSTDTDAIDAALSAAPTDLYSHWPQGVIPYTIADDLHDDLIPRVMEAINYWNTNTNIRLVHRTTQADYVTFRRPPGGEEICASFIGRHGGQQPIYLSLTRCNLARVIHEIGHTVGLWHEHSRNDRDAHIDILWWNIIPHKKDQFLKTSDYLCHYKSGGSGPCREVPVGPYDARSRMHYYSYNFTANGEPTLRRKDGGLIYMRDELSALDIAGVNALYPLGQAAPPAAPSACGVLRAGEGLDQASTWFHTSCNGRFTLFMQQDSNVTLFQNWPDFRPLWWAAGAAGSGGNRLYVQSDGNVVLYRADMSYVWNTGTNGHPGAWLAVQDDGNLVVYNSANQPVWATMTVQPWAAPPAGPPPDTTPPAITANITAGAVYSGSLTIVVNGSDDRSGVASIQLLVDGNDYGTQGGGVGHFVVNTLALAEGGHTLSFMATDGVGNTARADVAISVDNAAPTVAFRYPSVSVYETIPYAPPVAASDATGVSRIEFYLDDVYRGDFTYCGACNGGEWYPQSLLLPPGAYKMTAVAHDALGHKATAVGQVYVAPFDMCAYGCSPECPELCG